MPEMSCTVTEEWISLRHAARLLDTYHERVRRLITEGRIRERRLLGGNPFVLRGDVIRVLSEAAQASQEQVANVSASRK